jgi:photosynthetic reaction center cytochrome c subunit
MHGGRVALRSAGVTLGLVLAAALFSGAQQQQPAAVKTADQQYKNIQVLKGMPVDQFNLSMHAISAELGVECGYCHVGHGNLFPLDDKPAKNTARKMMQMVMDINKNNFGGRTVVTCYTCHQGHPDPVGTITLPLPTFIETFDEPGPPVAPTADQILAKYIQALGGEQAIRKVTSRLITATMEIPSGPGGTTPVPSQVEQYRKAPNLTLNINHTPTYTVSDGFDGTTAWTQDMNGVVSDVAFALDQGRIKRGADFYETLNLKQQYARMVVLGVERVNDREVYAVNGVPQGDSVERLYFDMQTGLLLRKITILPTPFGNIPFQVDYDNYRDTGSGVKYPFLIHMIPTTPRSEAQTQTTILVQKVHDNLDIDDAKFAKPQSKPAK